MSSDTEKSDANPKTFVLEYDRDSVFKASKNLSSKLFDVKLRSSDGQELESHKVLLAMASPVFNAMFDSDMKEAKDGIVEMKDADAETIRS